VAPGAHGQPVVIAGHFAFAAAVKSRETSVPLWALMLATQWLDVVFVPLFLTGIERIELLPGSKGGYGQAIIYADYTHSLLGAVFLATSFGAVAAWRWGRRRGAVLGFVVFSHWILDAVVHHRDMPILPANAGGLSRVGFDLWASPSIAVAVELALVLVGTGLYWRSALQSSQSAGIAPGHANVAGGVALAVGLTTLAIDAAGY
jgi:membrane-bound metal-dependent hydrolase YbcI (DUF457 family)